MSKKYVYELRCEVLTPANGIVQLSYVKSEIWEVTQVNGNDALPNASHGLPPSRLNPSFHEFQFQRNAVRVRTMPCY